MDAGDAALRVGIGEPEMIPSVTDDQLLGMKQNLLAPSSSL